VTARRHSDAAGSTDIERSAVAGVGTRGAKLDLSGYPDEIRHLWKALPYKPWAYERPLSKAEANHGLKAQWLHPKVKGDWIDIPGIGLNADKLRRFITVECDHDELDRWRMGRLRPFMIVSNPGELQPDRADYHHVTFEIAKPVTRGENALLKPQVLESLIYRALVRDLRGDINYPRGTTKNPIAEHRRRPRFRVDFPGGVPMTLKEMATLLDLDGVIEEEAHAARKAGRRLGLGLSAQNSDSRNVALFDAVRWDAYREVWRNWDHYHTNADWSGLQSLVRGWLNDANVFAEPLPDYDLDATAKSITKFCRVRLKRPAGEETINRGIMAAHFTSDMTLKDRQVAAGVRSARLEKAAMHKRVEEAVAAMQAAGQAVSVRAVSSRLGISTRTARVHLQALKATAGKAVARPAGV